MATSFSHSSPFTSQDRVLTIFSSSCVLREYILTVISRCDPRVHGSSPQVAGVLSFSRYNLTGPGTTHIIFTMVFIKSFLLFSLVSLAVARPVARPIRREVPQEHSHEAILRTVRDSLNLNNPDKIVDPVFSLLGDTAAAAGAGDITVCFGTFNRHRSVYSSLRLRTLLASSKTSRTKPSPTPRLQATLMA